MKSNWRSALILFVSVFALYAIYLWLVKENHDLPRVLLESLGFSGVLTVVSTILDVLRGKFLK
jgi:hypothetical protein